MLLTQMLLSGGVDSTVCAALLHKALNSDQVIAVHIDNGFMRKKESDEVEKSLNKLGLKVRGLYIRASFFMLLTNIFVALEEDFPCVAAHHINNFFSDITLVLLIVY